MHWGTTSQNTFSRENLPKLNRQSYVFQAYVLSIYYRTHTSLYEHNLLKAYCTVELGTSDLGSCDSQYNSFNGL